MHPLAPTALFTSLALVAFASNSILTRLALGAGHVDAATFTLVRLVAGAAILVALVELRRPAAARAEARSEASVRSTMARATGPITLFAYAAPFSFAYLRVGAGLGALVLFGAVQVTMMGAALARGERPGARAYVGLGLAVAGLAWLTVPSAARPDPLGVALMTVAGASWALYTLAGRSAREPLAANARSFALAVPLAVVLVAIAWAARPPIASSRGLALALVSGAITSGLGYAIWYRALRGLSASSAAILQLAVPVLAALGGVVFLDESVSLRLVTAALAVLGGIALGTWPPRAR